MADAGIQNSHIVEKERAMLAAVDLVVVKMIEHFAKGKPLTVEASNTMVELLNAAILKVGGVAVEMQVGVEAVPTYFEEALIATRMLSNRLSALEVNVKAVQNHVKGRVRDYKRYVRFKSNALRNEPEVKKCRLAGDKKALVDSWMEEELELLDAHYALEEAVVGLAEIVVDKIRLVTMTAKDLKAQYVAVPANQRRFLD